MKICTVDIESTAIPSAGIFSIDKIFCIGVKVNNEPTKVFTYLYTPYSDGSLQAAIALINSCDLVVGHNIAKFDKPVIENLIGKITVPVWDTMIAAKIMYTQDKLMSIDAGIKGMPKDQWGRYSLKAFGYRFGDYKLQFDNFTQLTEEMTVYCKQDVDLTYRLYLYLSSQEFCPNNETMKLECKVGEIVARQQAVGFYIDREKARSLFLDMKFKADNLERQLLRVFKPKFLPDGDVVTPAKPRREKRYVPNPNYQFKSRIPFRRICQLERTKNGKWKLPAKSKYKFFTEPHTIYYSYIIGEYQKIKLTKFNPSSRQKIQYWLKQDYNYDFPYYTPTGNPKVDAESLEGLDIPEGALLKEYLKLKKDLSQLEGGDGAILKNIREDSTVTSNIDTNGTVTGRFSSSAVNLNQIPSQKEFRELFSAPDGWKFLGADFSQQELVNLAELLYPYDGGRYYEIVANGDKSKGTDIHSINAKALGVTRDEGKAINFGFLYGSSETLTGYTTLGGKEYTDFTAEEHGKAMDKLAKRKVIINGIELYPLKKGFYVPFDDKLGMYMLYGRMLQQKLIQSTDGLGELIHTLTKQIQDYGYATTKLGRRIPAESPHVALNYHCQGMGGEAMKMFLTVVDEHLSKYNPFTQYRHQASIYDEIDAIVKTEIVDDVAKVVFDAFPETSRRLNMKCLYTGEVKIGNNWYECH